MNEKPTRPPPRKFKLPTKPPVTSSQMELTSTQTTAATTTTTTTTTTTATVKPKWKSLDKNIKKTNKLKPWKKKKVLNKPASKPQMKNSLKKDQSKKTPVVKSVKDKPKKNQTSTSDFKWNTLKSPKIQKGNKIQSKATQPQRKVPPRPGAQKPNKQEKNSIKLEESRKEYNTFLNKTKINFKVKTNRTMQNKLQGKQ